MTKDQIQSNAKSAKIVMPFTKQGGFGYMDGTSLPICLVQMLKGKDLFVGKIKGDLNANGDTKPKINEVSVQYWESKYQLNNIKESVLCVKSLIK